MLRLCIECFTFWRQLKLVLHSTEVFNVSGMLIADDIYVTTFLSYSMGSYDVWNNNNYWTNKYACFEFISHSAHSSKIWFLVMFHRYYSRFIKWTRLPIVKPFPFSVYYYRNAIKLVLVYTLFTFWLVGCLVYFRFPFAIYTCIVWYAINLMKTIFKLYQSIEASNKQNEIIIW